MRIEMAEATTHGLHCPACKVDLVMSERQGIEIDYCPKCRGVWLDRGELDKIIERGTGEQQQSAQYERQDQRRFGRDYDDDDDFRRGGRRRGGFLSDLFD